MAAIIPANFQTTPIDMCILVGKYLTINDIIVFGRVNRTLGQEAFKGITNEPAFRKKIEQALRYSGDRLNGSDSWPQLVQIKKRLAHDLDLAQCIAKSKFIHVFSFRDSLLPNGNFFGEFTARKLVQFVHQRGFFSPDDRSIWNQIKWGGFTTSARKSFSDSLTRLESLREYHSEKLIELSNKLPSTMPNLSELPEKWLYNFADSILFHVSMIVVGNIDSTKEELKFWLNHPEDSNNPLTGEITPLKFTWAINKLRFLLLSYCQNPKIAVQITIPMQAYEGEKFAQYCAEKNVESAQEMIIGNLIDVHSAECRQILARSLQASDESIPRLFVQAGLDLTAIMLSPITAFELCGLFRIGFPITKSSFRIFGQDRYDNGFIFFLHGAKMCWIDEMVKRIQWDESGSIFEIRDQGVKKGFQGKELKDFILENFFKNCLEFRHDHTLCRHLSLINSQYIHIDQAREAQRVHRQAEARDQRERGIDRLH